jgi:hypothetical protein
MAFLCIYRAHKLTKLIKNIKKFTHVGFILIHLVDVCSSDTLSRIGGNISRRDQSHVNIRQEVLDCFNLSREVIVLHPVLMYYAIEIDSSLFLSGSFPVLSGIFSPSFFCSLDVDISSLFIVEEPANRV